MLIQNEQDLLNVEVRKKLIKAWQSDGNQRRKEEAFKGYECLKDKTHHYVYGLLRAQFDLSTVIEMQYALSNISFLRKVIEKLAKVYANGVKRTMKKKSDTEAVEQAAEVLKMNTTMKEVNRYFKALKNTLAYSKPLPVGDGKFDLCVEPVLPFNYDVVEVPGNPKLPMAVVLSDYAPTRPTLYALGDAALARPQIRSVGQVRADDPDAAILKQSYSSTNSLQTSEVPPQLFIWWTKSFHFTTNEKGEIVSGDDIGNPIVRLPFVNFAGEQDNNFWAEGGQDLIDAGIKINTLITNLIHVAISQGYGQLYMTGENLPKSVKVGPNHCVQLEYKKDEHAAPTIGYLNSNPPIDSLKSLVEMYVALMLTTNNLSTSGFSTSLQGGKDFASGIALMIDKSESNEDVADQAQVFIENEPEIWEIVQKWQEVYKSRGLLSDEFAALVLPKNIGELQLIFPSPKTMLSEMEQLDVYAKRLEMGLNTMLEIIMRDNPALTETEAKEKLKLVLEEKIQRQMDAMNNQAGMDQINSGAAPESGSVSATGTTENTRIESRQKHDRTGSEKVLVSNKTGKVIRVLE